MKKILLFACMVLLLDACSIYSEMTALSKCEFRLHSLEKPSVQAGRRTIPYPGYFTLTTEFSSGD